ncbi:MAG: hypothetical protein QM770_16265 [Tepidisphaeraceae bacterium]
MQRIESLEQRRLLASDILATPLPWVSLTSKGTLNVEGSTSADFVEVKVRGSQYWVTTSVQGSPGEKVLSKFAKSAVKRIVVNAGAGSDRITVQAGVTDPITVLGGAGHDAIDAFNQNVTISGGAGRDQIRHLFDPEAGTAGTTQVFLGSANTEGALAYQVASLPQSTIAGPRGERTSARAFTTGTITNVGVSIAFSESVIDGGADNDSIATNCVGEDLRGGGGTDTFVYSGRPSVTFESTPRPTIRTEHTFNDLSTVWASDFERTVNNATTSG